MKKTYLNFSFNSTEFHSIALKFRNLSGKIDTFLNSGKFWEFSKSQQDRLLSKLRRLFEKLSNLDLRYAMKIAGAALCFTLISGAAKALPTFNDFVNPVNPFSFSLIFGNPIPIDFIADGAFVDMDGDATPGNPDLDAIILTYFGAAYFENVNGQYIENEAENPFRVSYNYGPGCSGCYPMGYIGMGIDIADFDGDGDLDAILVNSGMLTHYQMVDGLFKFVSGSYINVNYNSYSGTPFGYCSQAKFSDVDGDATPGNPDLDIVCAYGCSATYLGTLIQQSNHTFIASSGYPVCGSISTNPPYSNFINMADMDGDGDEDLFVFNGCAPTSPGLASPGSGPSMINYFENQGSAGFNRVTSGIPLPDDLSSDYFPILADLDGDGDIDVFTPGNGGANNFQNLSAPPVPISPFVALLAFAATGFGIFRKNRKKKTE
jgi:hypothetical protein